MDLEPVIQNEVSQKEKKNKHYILILYVESGLSPWCSDGKESACCARNPGLIPVLGRSPREGHGNPLQYSCLENSTDRGAWQATVHGVTQSQI